MTSLPPTSLVTLVTQWQVDWVTVGLAIAATAWYLAMCRRLKAAAQPWPRRRTALFLVGVAAYLWLGNGFPNAYSRTLLWVWSVQVLTLFLLVPVLVMAGQPIVLARRTARTRSVLDRALMSLPGRLVGHRLIGPAVVPIVCALLFFAHGADLYNGATWVATLMGVGLVAVGCLIAAPLTIDEPEIASLAVGLMLVISVLELLTDAIPGIVLRLETHLVTDHFAIRHAGWAMSPFADQKLSGGILWGVAEMLDLPFLIVVFLRWIRADQREAQRHDQFQGRTADAVASAAADGVPAQDAPWWLSDEQMQQRPTLRPRSAPPG